MMRILSFATLAIVIGLWAGGAAAQNARVDLSNAWHALVVDDTDVLLQPSHGAKKVTSLQIGEQVVVYASIGSFRALAKDGRHFGFVPSDALGQAESRSLSRPATDPVSPAPSVGDKRMSVDPTPDMPQWQPHAKDPSVATLLSFLIVGGGQFYSGRGQKGALLLISSVGSAVGGMLLSDFGGTVCRDEITGIYVNGNTGREEYTYATRCRVQNPDFTPLYVGIAASTAFWIVGMATASSDAERWNQRNARPTDVRIGVVPAPGTGEIHAGVKLSMRF